MTTLTHDTLDDFVTRLKATARNRGRDLCGRCAGSLTSPCHGCHRRYKRIARRHDEGFDAVQIAVAETLPAWRVEQILDHIDTTSDVDSRRTRTGDALRLELGDGLVDLLLAGAPKDRAERREYLHYRDLLLGAQGWSYRTANAVLNGSHIPNRPLRAAYLEARKFHGDALSSNAMARLCGLIDDTHFARHIGLRADSKTRKTRPDGSVQVYGGQIRPAIDVRLAERIAIVLDVHPTEIPGL